VLPPHHADMRAFLLGPILFLVPFFQGIVAADANPILLQPLCDQELAANQAGRTLAIVLESQTGNGQAVGMEMPFLPQSLSGIQTLMRETGSASLTQAEMSLRLRATLTNTSGLRSAF